MNRRLERIFGRRINTEAQQKEQNNMPVVDIPLSNYQQWYERDPALLDKECSLLQDAGIQFECRKLPDARLSFVLSVSGKQVGITCPYLYPVEPPQPFVLEDVQIPAIVGNDGKIDLFAHDGFAWSASTHIIDVIERIKTLLSIMDSMNPQRVTGGELDQTTLDTGKDNSPSVRPVSGRTAGCNRDYDSSTEQTIHREKKVKLAK